MMTAYCCSDIKWILLFLGLNFNHFLSRTGVKGKKEAGGSVVRVIQNGDVLLVTGKNFHIN